MFLKDIFILIIFELKVRGLKNRKIRLFKIITYALTQFICCTVVETSDTVLYDTVKNSNILYEVIGFHQKEALRIFSSLVNDSLEEEQSMYFFNHNLKTALVNEICDIEEKSALKKVNEESRKNLIETIKTAPVLKAALKTLIKSINMLLQLKIFIEKQNLADNELKNELTNTKYKEVERIQKNIPQTLKKLNLFSKTKKASYTKLGQEIDKAIASLKASEELASYVDIALKMLENVQKEAEENIKIACNDMGFLFNELEKFINENFEVNSSIQVTNVKDNLKYKVIELKKELSNQMLEIINETLEMTTKNKSKDSNSKIKIISMLKDKLKIIEKVVLNECKDTVKIEEELKKFVGQYEIFLGTIIKPIAYEMQIQNAVSFFNCKIERKGEEINQNISLERMVTILESFNIEISKISKEIRSGINIFSSNTQMTALVNRKVTKLIKENITKTFQKPLIKSYIKELTKDGITLSLVQKNTEESMTKEETEWKIKTKTPIENMIKIYMRKFEKSLLKVIDKQIIGVVMKAEPIEVVVKILEKTKNEMEELTKLEKKLLKILSQIQVIRYKGIHYNINFESI